MSINTTHTITLDSADISTVICGLQWSINHHNSLDMSCFDGQEEKTSILERHYRLKDLFNSKISAPLCPRPPETSDTALSSTDDVDGGILAIAKRLKEIKEEINLINGAAFQNATLTDAQHYQLLDVEMFIDDFIAPYSYREIVE